MQPISAWKYKDSGLAFALKFALAVLETIPFVAAFLVRERERDSEESGQTH